MPFVPVRYIRMAWGCLVANMPNGQAYDFVDYSERTWLNGNFSLSKWNVHLMLHAQITLKGGTAELRPWQERLT